jgi:hypothetical protein
MKIIHPVGAELFHADGRQRERESEKQTDRHMTQLIVAFLNIADAPKN